MLDWWFTCGVPFLFPFLWIDSRSNCFRFVEIYITGLCPVRNMELITTHKRHLSYFHSRIIITSDCYLTAKLSFICSPLCSHIREYVLISADLNILNNAIFALKIQLVKFYLPPTAPNKRFACAIAGDIEFQFQFNRIWSHFLFFWVLLLECSLGAHKRTQECV